LQTLAHVGGLDFRSDGQDTIRRTAHCLFDLSPGDPDQAAAFVRAKMWPVGADERYRDALAPGDLILFYLASPGDEFIGQDGVASAVHEWTSAEAEGYPGGSPGGLVLSHTEGWDPPVAMAAVLPRVDPDASNPLVQANAKAGFRTGVIRITSHECETVLAVRAENLPAAG
jgi:hypothetical protein